MREVKKFEILAGLKRESIMYDFDADSSSLIQGYTSNEIVSWDRQYAEAVAYQLDATSIVPMLSNIATARGIAVSVLVGKVLENAIYFQHEIGRLLGVKQLRSDKLRLLEADVTLTAEEKINNLDLI